MRWQTGGSNIPTDLTRAGSQELAATESLRQFEADSLTTTLLPKHVEAERLQSRAISEEDPKVLEEQIKEKQRETSRASAVAPAVAASVAAVPVVSAQMQLPKDVETGPKDVETTDGSEKGDADGGNTPGSCDTSRDCGYSG